MKLLKKVFLPLSLSILIGFSGIYYQFISFVNSPIVLTTNEVIFEIKPGTSAKKLAYNLYNNKILTYPKFFFLLAKISKLDTKIQAGEYLINNSITPKQLLNKFVEGKVILYSFTIIEGWNIYQLINAINESPKIKRVINELNVNSISKNLEINTEHPEGWFYPDTYYYSATTSELELLRKIHEKQKQFLDIAWQNRTPNVNLENKYQALILASIVEKETGIKEEMPVVARVYLNRLQKGMRLQADPTVIYGLEPNFNNKLSIKELKQDTPYNTYIRKNLPPTPICMPSKQAILAVMQPDVSDYLYFVANGDGGHTFSRTLQEHNKAVTDFKAKLIHFIH